MIPSYMSLTIGYCREHGLRKAAARTFEWIWDRIAHAALIVYVTDLEKLDEADCVLPPGITVVRRRSEAEMEREEVEFLSDFYSPKIVKAQFKERFERNASLWLARKDGRLVAHNWIVNGRPIESYLMPLTAKDGYSFDAGTLKELRGQGIFAPFEKYTWCQMKKDGITRIYHSTNEWNRPKIRQMAKHPVTMVGRAHHFRVFGREFVIWSQMCHGRDACLTSRPWTSSNS